MSILILLFLLLIIIIVVVVVVIVVVVVVGTGWSDSVDARSSAKERFNRIFAGGEWGRSQHHRQSKFLCVSEVSVVK